jgi:RHS repeat-associated protein
MLLSQRGTRNNAIGLLAISVALLGLLTLPSAASATALPATITENMTLTPAGNPYTGSPTIQAGVTVKVEPGVKLTVVGMTIKGTLEVNGSAEEPVVFTGAKEESKGEWQSIRFEPGSGASVIDNAELKYGGAGTPAATIYVNGSSPTIKNSTIHHSLQRAIYTPDGGAPEISNNVLYANSIGIEYLADGTETGEINIHGNSVEGGTHGIYVHLSGSGSIPGKTLGSNTITKTTTAPLTYKGPDLPGNVTGNTLSGNTPNLIVIGGTVASSATWNDGGVPVKFESEGATVASGATLTITKGLLLRNPNLTVKGTLNVEGTAEKPVVFTGTNESSAGEWQSIRFESGSGASVIDHAELKYGGGGLPATSIYVNRSSPTIKNSTIHHSSNRGIYASDGGAPEIADNTLYANKVGIEYLADGTETGEINIYGNSLEGGSHGIYVALTGSGSIPGKTLGSNTITKTTTAALTYKGADIPGNITGNTLSANSSTIIYLSGTVASSSTWNSGGVPIMVESGGITVASGATLKITKGLLLRNPNMTVKGTLNVEGTAEEPVIFTGANEKSKGEWQGIRFESGSGASVIDHAELKYGGAGSPATSIYVNRSSPTIKNSTIRNSSNRAIYASDGGAPEIANNILYANSIGIEYLADGTETGEINIHGNSLEGGSHGIYVALTGSGSIPGKTLGSNTITKTTTAALTYKGTDIPSNVTDNALVANTPNVIFLGGTVASSATWNDGGVPIRVESEGITVASAATLKVTKGVLLRNPNLFVKGTLNVAGTAEDPVVFTGANESSPGEWQGIRFEAGSGSSVIDYAEVAYGGKSSSGMIEMKGSHPKVTNSTIRNSQNYGIKVTESGAPQIEWNRFRANANGLSYSGTGNLSAPNNDWGCASGPNPAGCGDSATSNVKWNPTVQLPELAGPCRGQESQCPEDGDPVSLATGDLSYAHRDLFLANKSNVPLEFSRSYSSGSAADTGLGPGWSQTGLASATELASRAVLILRQDGRQDLFYKTESGYQAPSGVTSTLAKVEGTFQLTTPENTVYRFDASGRIASITDDHGLKTTYGYDANGRLATITDPSSQTLTFSYNASNHITSVKDSTGREVKYGYSGAGDLATVTDALGGVTEYTYDAAHRIKTIKDPRGNVILKNTYDGQGRVVEQKDALENLWKLEYKEGETVVTEPEGGKTTHGFDAQGRVVSEKDQLGRTTTTSYNAAGNIDEIVKPGGAQWQFGHDAAGNITSVIDPEEGERSYEYDGKNRLVSFTDEREETWAYEWDETNDLKKVTDPAGRETRVTYNASGQPLTVTDPNEHTTTFTYDTRGNRLTAEDALEYTTTFAYNTRNQLTSKTAPGLEPEAYGRNALGDLLFKTTPEGNKTEYAYDANGMLTKVTDPAEGVWEVKRNAMERPTAYVDPLEHESKISYDGNLRPFKVTDRRGKETTYAYDLANQLSEIVRPEGGDWEFDYDPRGNRIEVVDPRENVSAYDFDLLDRMTESAESLAATTSYEYDPTGNLVAFTDPRENTTALSYDELGRLTAVNQPLEKTTNFTYDGVGNRLTRTTAAGTIDFDYDAANRLEEISNGESTLRAFAYDPAGRLIGAADAQADEIEIGYDDDGRVTSIDDGRGQTVSREYDSRGNVVKQVDGRGTLEYAFDKLSRMIELTDPQGKVLDFDYDSEGNLTKAELPSGIVTTNDFDDAGRLAETTSANGGATLEALEYEFDPNGNRIVQVDRLSQETSYEYDALNRLVDFDPPGEGSTAYAYDPAGNRTEAGATTYEFNDLNQLTSAADGTTYDYDDTGRLVEATQGETSTTYDWNVLDELTGVDTGSQEIDFAYDALGRQVLRDDGSTIRPTHYGDLSDLPIFDTDAEGEPTVSYVQGPSGLVEQRSGEATSFPLRDARGDLTTIANGKGEVASRQTYDPWGGQLSGPAVGVGFLGAQQRRGDPATGLVQMGARAYDPALGRFLSEDPVVGQVGLGATFNRYPYASNNPLNRNDLDGRETCVPTPFGTACAPVTLHPPVPTPSDPVPDLPITIDGAPPTAPSLINNLLPDPPVPGAGEVVGTVADRALAFFKEHGADLVTGCVTGGAGGFLIFNVATGGTPILIPIVGPISEGGAALGGCVIGAGGLALTGVNPIRRN